MKALNRKSIIAVALLGSMVVVASASAGIKDTPHNLSSVSASDGDAVQTDPVNAFSGTAEICVFCHTPHAAAASSVTQAPLWNKTLPSMAAYTVYDAARSSSIDGSVDLTGSVSLACLSCHDGTQAMDVMINKPGSGDPVFATNNWVGDATGGLLSGGVNNEFANLGTDISNDHPVGIQYGGGGIEATTTGTTIVGTTADADFVVPKTKLINSAPVWWLDTGTVNNTREKSDIQLYSRSSTTLANGVEPFVECASCHDPHESTNATFLRVSNDSSAVCLACHDK
jgi:predicted CXXCH cytochrome family protein